MLHFRKKIAPTVAMCATVTVYRTDDDGDGDDDDDDSKKKRKTERKKFAFILRRSSSCIFLLPF